MEIMNDGKSNGIGVPVVIDRAMKENMESRGAVFNVQDTAADSELLTRDLASMARLRGLVARIQQRWDAGQPIFRDAALFREEVASMWKLENHSWFSEVQADPRFRSGREFEGEIVDSQSAFMTWVALRLRGVSHTSNWFRPSEGLVYKLLATDLGGALVGDLRLPAAAFYIELPPKVFYLDDKNTGWHEIRALTVIQGEITERTLAAARGMGDPSVDQVRLGERVVIEAYGEPNTNSKDPFDDTWLFKSYYTGDKSADIEIALQHFTGGEEDTKEAEVERRLNRGRLGDRVLDGMEIRSLLLRFVLNFCVYLGSEKASVAPLHEDEIVRLHGGKKFKNLRKPVQQRIRDLQNDKVFLVGTDVVVDNEIKEIVRTEGTGGYRLTYRVLVRGHWRNQAHGPARALRTRRWIQPHVRGTELPTPVVGHSYKVE